MTGRIRTLDLTAATDGSDAVLEGADFRVLPAEGAVDALKRLDGTPADCVVLGANLPGMAVDEFLRRARERSPSLPAVIVDPDDAAATSRALSMPHTAAAGDPASVPERVRDAVARRRADRARDRHARLERTFRSITRDALKGPSAEAVARAAHDHLTASGCYRFVWIGTYDGASDELRLRAPFEGTFDPAEVTAGVASGRPAFLERAVSEGEVTTTDGPGATRAAAATAGDNGGTAGAMTTAAVPLDYDGENHGVVVAVSDRPHAFDGAERALLSDLGAVLGHAMAGAGDDAAGRERCREFAAALAHEVRNPIGMAETYLELAQEGGDPADIEQAAAALERAESIVGDLLSIAGRETVAETSEGSLAEDANAAWDRLEAPDATLETESPGSIEADHDLLVRLLANLFANATEHGGEGTTVRVGPMEDGFYVADDGPGIPPGEREVVFEWGHGDGTGIGLSLVEAIADAHGWTVTVTEAEGGGARFEITGVGA